MRRAFNEIREWIDFACDTCGCPQLKDKIRFEFNGRLTNRLADAKSSWTCGSKWKSGQIRISRALWARNPGSEKRNTIIHETCHIIGDYQGNSRVIHGPAWKALMVQCDEEPNRCHNIDRTGIRRQRKKQRVYCGCLRKMMGATQYSRLKKGTSRYTCKTCRQELRLEP